jgi:hypothetical protein
MLGEGPARRGAGRKWQIEPVSGQALQQSYLPGIICNKLIYTLQLGSA